MNKENLMTVNTVAKMTGITIRTLHYYDEIGLLSPSSVSDAKYRLYSNADLDRLQQILFFKEVGFNLKEIKSMMNDPVYSEEEALKKHIGILLLKRKRINELIDLIDRVLKGETEISFDAFNEDKIIELQKRYHQEVLERWENTIAYQQYKNTSTNLDKDKNDNLILLNNTAKKIFTKIYQHIDESPSSKEVQTAIHEWRLFISQNYYDCSIEMLRYLGSFYISDERFTKTINGYGDERLAQFINQAIMVYCKNSTSKES